MRCREGRFLTSGGLGTMGYSIPAALGAKLARPNRAGSGYLRRRLFPDEHVRAGHHLPGSDWASKSSSCATPAWAWCGSCRTTCTASVTAAIDLGRQPGFRSKSRRLTGFPPRYGCFSNEEAEAAPNSMLQHDRPLSSGVQRPARTTPSTDKGGGRL